jgi:hypothetical protein
MDAIAGLPDAVEDEANAHNGVGVSRDVAWNTHGLVSTDPSILDRDDFRNLRDASYGDPHIDVDERGINKKSSIC